MAKITFDLYLTGEGRKGNLSYGDPDSWHAAECPNCGASQMFVIARTDNETHPTVWLRCISCRQPAVAVDGVSYPPVRPLGVPLGLPSTESTTWQEVRECLSVGANTAAVMLCRKLLLHVGVTHGLPEKNDKGRGPTFMEAIEHLENEGIITAKMKPWINRIKDVGNEANHEISPVSEESALDVASFTEQLLRLAYEMTALMAKAGESGVTATS